MRSNLPVTTVEQELGSDALIVSRTDLKGRITYVNRDFVEISGYSENELIGEPHNLVRHPDMPVEAFRDLWESLRDGRPWSGYVKNRCKNGNYYWVDANVTPIWENGQIVGYLSVRRKPERSAVEAAEAAYRLFREQRATGKRILGGRVVSSGLLARLGQRLRNLSLSRKLVLATSFLLAGVMTLVATALSINTTQMLEKDGVQGLNDKLQLVRNNVDVLARSAKKESGRLLEILLREFSGSFSLVDSDKDVPTLKAGSTILNQRTDEIDRFLAKTQVSATILARKGNDFVRISTTDKEASGKRQTGSRLGNSHPATASLLAGKGYFGRSLQGGREYYSGFLPIKDAEGKVIGALSTTHDFQEEMQALKQQIKAVKLGTTGYFYVLEAGAGSDLGKLAVHPAKEGDNLLAVRDAGGREFIREILEKKQGTIVYPWLNKELGDTSSRDKIVVYDHFPEWNWVIAGGTYLDEFYGLAHSLRRSLALVSLAVVLILAALISWLMHRTVNTPLREVLDIFRTISGGNYSTRIDVSAKDEVGNILQGLQSMQTRLGFEVGEAKRASEEMARVKTALDGAAMPMTISDGKGELIYLNAAAQALWQGMEVELRKRHPDFSASQLLGCNLANFLDDVEMQEAYRAPLQSTKTFDAAMGGRILHVTATPVHNAAGQYIGRSSQWSDRTLEVQIEREVAAIINAAGQGDFSQRLAVGRMSGFFRQISEGINTLLESNSRALTDVGEMLARLARGDLTRKIETDYQGMLGKLKNDANTTIDNLHEIIFSIKEATDAINTAAKEIAAGNTDLSARTEEQASSLEETASSMEELSETVKQNAESARQANQLTSSAREVATRGGEVVGQVVQTMAAIHQSSSKIADIIGVIDGIAFQTNILALNAAVEAARAGEQGRGFAVVATEVRNLAQRSAAAAKEIKGLISDSVSKVEAGNRLTATAGETMGEVVKSILEVAKIVTEIAHASREQVSGIDQIARAVSQMDEVTQQNAALVEEAAAAAESLEEQTSGLAQAVSAFRLTGAELSTPGARRVASQPSRLPPPAKKLPAAREVLDDEWQEF